MREYDKPAVREFARQASIQESGCYMNLPEGLATRYPRVEEAVRLARKIGIAFCDGLRGEAETLTILISRNWSAGCVDMEVSEFIPGSLGRITGRKPK